jgi:hypothetical protein
MLPSSATTNQLVGMCSWKQGLTPRAAVQRYPCRADAKKSGCRLAAYTRRATVQCLRAVQRCDSSLLDQCARTDANRGRAAPLLAAASTATSCPSAAFPTSTVFDPVEAPPCL